MTNYRRLISYIYAYEGEIKGKNIGFAKLESRNGQCKLSINVKKVYVGSSDLGVYLLAPGKEIFLGNIFIRSGSGEFRASVSVENAADSGCGMDECYGLSIHEPGDNWRAYTTIWEDAVAHAAELELAEVTSKSVGDPKAQIHKKVEELHREIQGAQESGELLETVILHEADAAQDAEATAIDSPEGETEAGEETVLAENAASDAAEMDSQVDQNAADGDIAVQSGSVDAGKDEIPVTNWEGAALAGRDSQEGSGTDGEEAAETEAGAFSGDGSHFQSGAGTGAGVENQSESEESGCGNPTFWQRDGAECPGPFGKVEEVKWADNNPEEMGMPSQRPSEGDPFGRQSGRQPFAGGPSGQQFGQRPFAGDPSEQQSGQQPFVGDPSGQQSGQQSFAGDASEQQSGQQSPRGETSERRVPWGEPSQPSYDNGASGYRGGVSVNIEPESRPRLRRPMPPGMGMRNVPVYRPGMPRPPEMNFRRGANRQPETAGRPGMPWQPGISSRPGISYQPAANNQSEPNVQPAANNQSEPNVQPAANNQSEPNVQPTANNQLEPNIEPVPGSRPEANVQLRRNSGSNSNANPIPPLPPEVQQHDYAVNQRQEEVSTFDMPQSPIDPQYGGTNVASKPFPTAENIFEQRQAPIEETRQNTDASPEVPEAVVNSYWESQQVGNTPVQPQFQEEDRSPDNENASENASSAPQPSEPVVDAGEAELPLGDPRVLERLEQEEQQYFQPRQVWDGLRKRYPKMQAFDSANGCEILSIKPQDIGLLPRENWNYGNNSFLLHGYYNYRYLILARIGDDTKGRIRYILGVPGHYYSNEKYMASMFGFPHFVLSKNQPSQDGRFGYWYTDVRLENQDQ